MSATTIGSTEPRSAASIGGAPGWLRIYFLAFSLPVICVLAFFAPDAWQRSTLTWSGLCAWLVVVVAADLAPVPVWNSVTLSMSLPVTLAVGMLYPAPIAGLIAFAGSLDRREFRGEVSLDRALYNRSQVALSVSTASLIFHSTGVSIQDWPGVLPAAALALASDFFLNSILVAFPLRFLAQVSFASALRNMIGFPTVRQHMISYVCVGVLAVSLAAVVSVAGSWGVVVSLAPLIIARRELLHASSLEVSARRIHEKNRALLAAVERVGDERRDERLVVAGELHDEILPPLFKVHLMGQVLRRDLDAGRLLNLDEDLPELLEATDAAQDAVRSLVGELRRSPLGPGGLIPTLGLLVQHLEHESEARLLLETSEVDCSPMTQLLVYQIAREALINAVRHSHAALISARLWQEGDSVRLLVEDDGIGFIPASKHDHFGLQMIVERAEAAQGSVAMETRPGAGTRIVASVPATIR